jgi:vacuolar-type H+-ATPase subunit E/Vma4
MASVEEKLAAFSRMVLETANKQRDDMMEKLQEDIDESVKKAEREFTENARENMEKEVLKKTRENNEKVLKLEAELKHKLLFKREGIIQEIFKNVYERVEKFTQDNGYGKWLKNKAEKAVEELGGKDCTVCVMKKDESYKAELEKLSGVKVELSEEDVLGGVIVYSKNKCVDYSLRTIIEQEQSYFLKNTDLSVS